MSRIRNERPDVESADSSPETESASEVIGGDRALISEVLPDALDGERLDRVVAVVAGVTRADGASLVDDGRVAVNGRPATKRSSRLSVGDRVSVTVLRVASVANLVADPDVAFGVAYEDDDVVVVDKPAGLVVHPGSGNQSGTLVHGLLARYPDIAALATGDQLFRPGIVHRLDKGTSGLLMVARTSDAVAALIRQLQERTVSRRYLALAHGRFAARNGTIDAPVGRSDVDPTRMTVSSVGREAITHYRVREAFERPDPVTLLECWLETGRTHQIRVHLSAIDHAVVGDPRYGGIKGAVVAPRPFLHAYSLRFEHPRTRAAVECSSTLPTDLSDVLATLA